MLPDYNGGTPSLVADDLNGKKRTIIVNTNKPGCRKNTQLNHKTHDQTIFVRLICLELDPTRCLEMVLYTKQRSKKKEWKTKER
jgi:hypothetical protein